MIELFQDYDYKEIKRVKLNNCNTMLRHEPGYLKRKLSVQDAEESCLTRHLVKFFFKEDIEPNLKSLEVYILYLRIRPVGHKDYNNEVMPMIGIREGNREIVISNNMSEIRELFQFRNKNGFFNEEDVIEVIEDSLYPIIYQ